MTIECKKLPNGQEHYCASCPNDGGLVPPRPMPVGQLRLTRRLGDGFASPEGLGL